MRPLLPCVAPQVGGHLPLLKPAYSLGSSRTAGGKVSSPFGSLLHDPLDPVGEHGAGHPGFSHSPADGESGRPSPRRKTPTDDGALDSSARHAAQLAPPSLASWTPSGDVGDPAQVEARVRSSLEDLLPALVRRVAWSGDGRRGTVRLELGAGELAGATLLIHVDDGRVRIQLSAPPGASLGGWRERIAERLAARGLAVDGVEVE